MKSKSAERQRVSQDSQDSDCHRQHCCLRIENDSGVVECLMEAVRDAWAMPLASNYCKHPSSRKFVDHMHYKLTSQ
jgi:hypothetical protein